MNQRYFNKIVLSHGKWVQGEEGGERANFRRADLSGASLRRADLRGANLGDANLSGADLSGADLHDANFRGANLGGASLRDANLRGADLRRADLSGANLSGAYLRHANLSGANLRRADLHDANFRDANLRGASLRDANLHGANLHGANLGGANLRRANLGGADLRGAKLPKTTQVFNLFTKIRTAIEDGGNLEMGDWHGCETTHCLAGWTTTLAGEGGRVAEDLLGTPWAAALIINESCPYLEGKVPNFYSKNEEAMTFINECAEKEKIGLDE